MHIFKQYSLYRVRVKSSSFLLPKNKKMSDLQIENADKLVYKTMQKIELIVDTILYA